MSRLLVPTIQQPPIATERFRVTGHVGVEPPPVRVRASGPGSALEGEVDAQVRDLLGRISARERLAADAPSDLEDFLGWPSWSMDTDLTPAQEKFVEHWSPQQVLESSRAVRQLVRGVQRWTGTHRDAASLGEALAVLTKIYPR